MTNPLTDEACEAAWREVRPNAGATLTPSAAHMFRAGMAFVRAELAKEEPVAYLGILAEDGCKTLEWKPHDVEHLDGDQYLPLYLRPCCHEYATCLRACTPRGEWIAQQRMKG